MKTNYTYKPYFLEFAHGDEMKKLNKEWYETFEHYLKVMGIKVGVHHHQMTLLIPLVTIFITLMKRKMIMHIYLLQFQTHLMIVRIMRNGMFLIYI